MTDKKERGIRELYEQDPERADALVFGRVPDSNRRGFLKGAGLAAMGAAVGSSIPFSQNMPAGMIPAALADSVEGFPPRGQGRRHDRAQRSPGQYGNPGAYAG